MYTKCVITRYVRSAMAMHSYRNGIFVSNSEFQARLEGNSLYTASMPRQVAYGAKISLKNHRTGGAYLHSHFHLYPEGIGARQQQVTTYSHKDENNQWLIKPWDREVQENDTVILLKDGDLLRLEHTQTSRNLHSHREEAPLTKRHNQVTCYGEKGVGDANDVWRLEVVKGAGPNGEVHTVTTKFRLIHYLANCALLSHNKQLPKWGFDQMEVTCTPNKRDKNAVWNVEDNWFSKLPSESFERYRPGFIQMFFESHAVMLQGNAGLKPKEGELTSRPWHWPINLRGQFFSGFEYRVYLLGNPLIWWSNLILLGVYFVLQTGVLVLGQRRGDNDVHYLTSSCRWLLLGWAVHYVPFYAMGRVLYFHHYFPALMFSSMLSGVVIDYVITLCIPTRQRHWVIAGLLSVIVYSFSLFSPLAYGMQGPPANLPNSTMHGLKWLDTWEF
ncbi:protein O-mannosyl-transferase 2-like isoform X2 [Varroa destructor]|uniref:Protein O-mannosyl-transferase 2 n=1 Tax=Varroa destructor TaxID=109461 RepID=A0A7M7M8D2_VARDE|nr:protein O-mannosyl-transferase 2-like isoform X2 [Varroa destructor]